MTKDTGQRLHAVLSPSGAKKWLDCPGSPFMETHFAPEEIPNDRAAQGTAAHFIAKETLDLGLFEIPYEWLGFHVAVGMHDGAERWLEDENERVDTDLEFVFELDDEMMYSVNIYLANAGRLIKGAHPEDIFIEEALNIEPITGEEGAKGTGDLVALIGNELQVHDLKYGMVYVSPETPQLKIYAYAAYLDLSLFYDIETVRLFIHQPRLFEEPGEITMTVDELEAFIEIAKVKAAVALDIYQNINAVSIAPDELALEGSLTAGAHCKQSYCKARLTCPAYKEFVDLAEADTVDRGDDPLDDDTLSYYYNDVVPIVQDWADQVVKLVHHRMLTGGHKLPGLKVVRGKSPGRKWFDDKQAEETLRGMSLLQDVLYERKLRSPAKLEKEAKAGNVGPRQWKKIEDMIHKPAGKPKVVSVEQPGEEIQLDAPENVFEDHSK